MTLYVFFRRCFFSDVLFLCSKKHFSKLERVVHAHRLKINIFLEGKARNGNMERDEKKAKRNQVELSRERNERIKTRRESET